MLFRSGRGDTDQRGKAFVTSCGGILDVVGAEGPEAVDVDGGAVELVAGMVEVAHADLAEVPRTVVVVEHTVVVHASGTIAASRILSVLPDAGHRRYCHRRHCPLNSIPPFSPRVGVSAMEWNEAGDESGGVYHMHWKMLLRRMKPEGEVESLKWSLMCSFRVL